MPVRHHHLLCAGFLALTTGALAVGTPANTTVTNTATLNFRTSLGDSRQISSNPVELLVRQVYAVTVSPDATADAIPAARQFGVPADQQRLVPYMVRNDSNGPDTLNLSVVQAQTGDDFDFTTAVVYADRDNNGVPDDATPLTQVTLNADAMTTVLVAVRTPATAQPGAVGKFALRAVSTGNPAVIDENNFAQVTVSRDAQLSISLSNTPQGSVQPGSIIRYSAQGSNTSPAPAGNVTGVVTVDGTPRDGIFVRDVLPGGMSLVSVAPTSGSSAGTTTLVYSTDGGQTWTATLPTQTGAVNAVGMLLTGSGAFFPSGATLTLTFDAAVPVNSPGGTDLSNQATVTFDGNGDGDGADPGEVATARVTNTTATATGAAFGPFEAPRGNGTGTYTFGGHQIDRSGDLQTLLGSVAAGTTASFKQTLLNTGNTTNTFNLAVDSAPAGWTCRVLNVDGTGAVGPSTNPVTLAPGATADVATECDVPFGAASATNQEVRVSATPTGGTPDVTVNRVAQVTAASPTVLGNSDGNQATPPNTAPVTVAAAPGTSARFPLELQNGAPVPESYTLTGTVPAGYPAPTFYLDTNCDGVPDGSPVTTTPSIPAGETLCLVAEVTLPVGRPAGQEPVTFTATGTTTPSRVSTLTNAVQVNGVASVSFGPNGAQSTLPGGNVVYAHTLTNTSNSPVTVTVPAFTSARGWTYEFSTDGTTYAPSLTGLTLAAGASTPLYVRVTVPQGYQPTAGDQEAAVIRVDVTTNTTPSSTGSATVTDTTTALRSRAGITKSAALCADAACATTSPLANGAQVSPGDVVLYTITATNDGDVAQNFVYVSDTVPTHTSFVSAGAAGSGLNLLYSVDSGKTWTASAPAGLPAGLLWVGVDSNGDGTVNASDTFTAGQSFSVRLIVRVQ
ncbi:hypothetical protein Dcar01_03358 [Deinococcus carri]|uniref:DUF11 domain-containing protein n=1 Tax=Deinococcus carri TaxID=1211323 RepID=A0ABP9WB78_9DEIO